MPNERSVGFASCKAFGRSTSGIHARPLSKVRCCRPKKFGRLPEGLSLHHPFQNRTIPRLALNLPPLSKGGGLTARHKLLLCCVLLAICPPFLYYKLFCRQDGGIASRCTEPIYPHDHCKRTITPRSHQPFSKPHYPSKIANALASLVKGRWIDGKTQALILLLSACDMPTLFILQTLLPSRRRDCLPLHQPSQNRTIPLAFRRARVCVCLYGFASVQNLGHTR